MSTTPAPTVEVDNVHVIYEVFEDRSQGLKQLFAAGQIRRQARRIHAVQGVSFSVYEGETLGIVGSNGSGKSTLLAAMTGLLPLESGDIRVRSRPALLGVSAALRASLSGRRNILIGCLALGLSPVEIDERIDEIIDFAGLRGFIDLPMRTYSSGMRARLNFSIASAATPSILLIDEALAVGDDEFQRRSQQRIDEIRQAAGSVVLVSHNLSEIERACDRAIWLEKGELRAEGDPAEVVAQYLGEDKSPQRIAVSPVGSTPKQSTEEEPGGQTTRGRRAVLHIGAATAGDGQLQADLHARRTELFSAGFTYPTFLGTHDHRMLAVYGSFALGPFAGFDEFDQWKSWRQDFRSNFLRATADGGDLVASSVALSLVPDAGGCREVAALLDEAGFENLEIVLFARRQDEYAALTHLRQVSRGRTAPFDLDEHLSDQARYDYEAIACRWEVVETVEKVHVRLHRDRESMLSNESRFAALVGLPPPGDDSDWVDAAYGPREVALQRAFNEAIAERDDVDRFAWLLGRQGSPTAAGLDQSDSEEILRAFSDSNKKVLARVPVVERIDDYFESREIAAAAELTYDIDDLWAFVVELAGHASLLGRQLRRHERDS